MTQSDCLFCKIVAEQIPAKLVHQDDLCLAFHDIHPRAPLHVLVVPRKHVATLNDLTDEDRTMMGHLHLTAAGIAKKFGHAEAGYRTVFNCNRGAGQTVFHIHLHLLAGRTLDWPPG